MGPAGGAEEGRLPAPAPPARLLPGPPRRDLPAKGGRNEPLLPPPTARQPAASPAGCRGTPRRAAIHEPTLARRAVTGPTDSPPHTPRVVLPLSITAAPLPTLHASCAARRGTAACRGSRRQDGSRGASPKAPAASLPFTAINSAPPAPIGPGNLFHVLKSSSSIPDSISRSVLKCCIVLPLAGK